MTLRVPAAFLLILLASYSHGQKFHKESYKLGGNTYAYYRTKHEGELKGILLLFPGKGEKPADVFGRTKLPTVLASKGFVTIVPDLRYTLFVDELTKRQLRAIVNSQSTPGRIERLSLALGGFSAGGSLAVSYAEYLISVDSAKNLSSVFAIDPPLDLERIYTSSEWHMKYACSESLKKEAKQTLLYLHDALGGSPLTHRDNYIARSPFLAANNDGGNAKWLKQVPIRLYSEPDLDFVRKVFCQDMQREDLNVIDLERMTQVVKTAGNTRAELILTKGRGYHSWRIIDPTELASWISGN